MASSPRPASGASVSRRRAKERFAGYIAHHRRTARESLLGLLKVWPASLMTWLAIGIALALPTILYVLLANISALSGDWDGQPRISVYLQGSLSEADGRAFSRTLETDRDIATLEYISAEQALTEFTARSGFSDVLNTLERNPLPALIAVEPSARQPASLKLLVSRLEAASEVDTVSFDLAWLERLFALLALAERFVTALGGFLSLGVLLVIGNTIRLAIENRRAEIEIVKLVGGTDGFVRRPFLYLGWWYGLGGALAAWLLVQFSLLFLSGPAGTLLASYQGNFRIEGLGFGESLLLLLIGAGLGVIGAGLAVGRHLSRIEPR